MPNPHITITPEFLSISFLFLTMNMIICNFKARTSGTYSLANPRQKPALYMVVTPPTPKQALVVTYYLKQSMLDIHYFLVRLMFLLAIKY